MSTLAINPLEQAKAIAQLPQVQQLLVLASTHSLAVYAVGGAVRDVLMGSPATALKDIDVSLTGPAGTDWARHVAAQLAEKEAARLVPLDKALGFWRVVYPESGLMLDLGNAPDIHSDLARRDLTVNAMALRLDSPEFLDPFDGLKDLQARQIRMLAYQNMVDDPLRLVRVFRFGAQLQASYDAETLACVQAEAHRLHPDTTHIAGERITQELFQWFSAPEALPSIRQAANTGLLEALFPELTPQRAIGPNRYHHLPVFEHTLSVVAQTEALLNDNTLEAPERIYLPLTPLLSQPGFIKLAALLHEVAKPKTFAKKPDPAVEGGERYTYYGHDIEGVTMAMAIGKRLHWGNKVLEPLGKLIRWHLLPSQFGPDSSRKSLLKLYRRLGPWLPHALVLSLADRRSAQGPALEAGAMETFEANHRWLMADYPEQEGILNQKPLLTGEDVMTLTGLPPGPKVGALLADLLEQQQLGAITTLDAAKAWLSEQI